LPRAKFWPAGADASCKTGAGGKLALGVVLATTGALILTGYDKPLETALLRSTPAWLADVATRF
jgi:hypothetical protein